MQDLAVLINGAGAAGIAIAELLRCIDHIGGSVCTAVKEIILCDSKGIIHREIKDLNEAKQKALSFTNSSHQKGNLNDAIKGADVFIGVSMGDLLQAADVQTMTDDSIIFALANPSP